MIDHTYARNSLTTCEFEGHAMTGNGSYVNLLIFFSKKVVKSHKGNLCFYTVLSKNTIVICNGYNCIVITNI